MVVAYFQELSWYSVVIASNPAEIRICTSRTQT